MVHRVINSFVTSSTRLDAIHASINPSQAFEDCERSHTGQDNNANIATARVCRIPSRVRRPRDPRLLLLMVGNDDDDDDDDFPVDTSQAARQQPGSPALSGKLPSEPTSDLSASPENARQCCYHLWRAWRKSAVGKDQGDAWRSANSVDKTP